MKANIMIIFLNITPCRDCGTRKTIFKIDWSGHYIPNVYDLGIIESQVKTLFILIKYNFISYYVLCYYNLYFIER